MRCAVWRDISIGISVLYTLSRRAGQCQQPVRPSGWGATQILTCQPPFLFIFPCRTCLSLNLLPEDYVRAGLNFSFCKNTQTEKIEFPLYWVFLCVISQSEIIHLSCKAYRVFVFFFFVMWVLLFCISRFLSFILCSKHWC